MCIRDSALEVQVRGPKDALEGIKINECVSIDLKAYVEPGIYDVPVTVKFPDTLLLFVTPPSAQELRSRLVGRGTETMDCLLYTSRCV